MTVSNRDKRFERAQTAVIFRVPFFAPGVARLPVVWDANVPTACTQGTHIRWNPAWFDKLRDSELVTVLCHEVCHCLLGHIWRAPDGADWDVWNQATDHAVNLMLEEFGAAVKVKGLADPFPFPPPAEAYCHNPAFKGLAEEVIYGRLYSQKPQSGAGNKPQAGSGHSGGVKVAPHSSGSPISQRAASCGVPNSPNPGSMPSFGDIEQPQANHQSTSKSLRNDWEGTLIQSCRIASGQGTLPAGMERLVSGIVNPRVPWQQILRSWLREQCADDWDWLTPAMEYDESGFILPSLRSERCGPIVFATDTSGSINEELLAQFQGEKQECLDQMRPRRLVDIYCDAKIHKIEEYAVGDTIGKEAPGGGGTDFRPVFEHVAKLPETVKAVVYLTDLWGDFPETDPGVPCIFVTWTKDLQAPFGVTVYAGE